LSSLSRRFSVSQEVILRRLLILGRTDETFYRYMRAVFQEEYRQYRHRLSETEGGPTWDRRAISRVGKLFARLAFENYYREQITAGDLAEYFGVKLRHMAAIEEDVFGRQIAFGATG
jgi:Zn-dependent peptidase ImmA (M78 family)